MVIGGSPSHVLGASVQSYRHDARAHSGRSRLRGRHLRHRRGLNPGADSHRLWAFPYEVAPATLASTFLTSIAGVITFVVLATQSHGPINPDWPVGIALGIGGLGGGYIGARVQSRLPELVVRRLLGVVVVAIGIRYLWLSVV